MAKGSNKTMNIVIGAEVKEAVSKTKLLAKTYKATGKQIKESASIAYKYNRKLGQSFTNLNKDANRSSLSIGKFGKALKNAFSIGAIMMASRGLATAVDSALAMIETQNLFNVAMGNTAPETEKAIQKLHELYGLDPTNIKNTMATYSLLGRSMGMAGDQAQKLAVNTYQAGLDYASLTNIPIEQVMQDLKSGLVGQSETVYKYGIDVTEAGLKQEAFAQGITKSVRNMSQGEKMALRSALIMRTLNKETETGDRIAGDFAKTLMTPANQLRVLKERFATLSRALGTSFIPMLQAVLPYLNALVSILIDVANAIAKFFGYEAPKEADLSGTIGSISEEAENAEDSVGGVTSAVKKLQKTMLGIDELNVMADNSASGAGGSGGAGGGGSVIGDIEIPDAMPFMGQIDDLTNRIKEKLLPILEKVLIVVGAIGTALLLWKIIGFVQGLESAVGGFAKLAPYLKTIGGFALVVAGLILIFEGVKGILEESEPSLKNFALALGGIVLVAGGLALAFSPMVGLIALIVGAVGLLGVYIYKYWDEIKAWTVTAWTNIKKFFVDTWDSIKSTFVNTLAKVKGFLTATWDSIKAKIVSVWDAVKNFITIRIPQIIENIMKWFRELPSRIAYALGFILGSMVKWALKMYAWIIIELPKIINSIVNWFKGLPSKIWTAILAVVDKLKAWYSRVQSWITTEVPKIITSVVAWFKGLPQKIYDGIVAVKTKIIQWGYDVLSWMYTAVTGVINSVVSWFKGIPQKIYDAIKNIRYKIIEIGTYLIDGILDGLRNFTNRLKNWGSSFIQGFKDALGIHSPSKLARDEIGKNLGLGIFQGLDDTKKDIVGSAMGIANGVQGAFDGVGLDANQLVPSDLARKVNLGSVDINGKMVASTRSNSDLLSSFATTVGGIMSSQTGDNEGDMVFNLYVDGVYEKTIRDMKRKNVRSGKVVIPVGV